MQEKDELTRSGKLKDYVGKTWREIEDALSGKKTSVNSGTVDAIKERLNQIRGTSPAKSASSESIQESLGTDDRGWYVTSEGKHLNPKFYDEYGNRTKKTTSTSGSSSNSTSNSYKTNNDIYDLINRTADSQYGQAENALRQRVAGILSQYSNQMKGVEGQYNPIYQKADLNTYQQNEATKAAMAKAGLLNTGIGQGYNQQNAFKANMARQDIDLQKQGQYDTINNSINDTKRDMEYDLNNLALEKSKFINSNMLQEAKDLRAIERDDYWKNRQMELSEAQFDFQKDSFDKQYSLEERKQIFAEDSWLKTYEMDEKKFTEMQDQFAKTYGLQNEQFAQSKYEFDAKLKQTNEQFDAQMGWSEQVHKDEMAMQTKQLNASIANSQRDYRMAMTRLQQETREYNDSLAQMADDKAVEESRRVDAAIAYGVLNGLDSNYMLGVVNTSTLSRYMKSEKIKMFNNAFSNNGVDTTTSADYYNRTR